MTKPTELIRAAFAPKLNGPRIELIKAEFHHTRALWESILRDRNFRQNSWPWLKTMSALEDYIRECTSELPEEEVFYLFQKDQTIFGSFHIHNLNYSEHKTEVGFGVEQSYEGFGYVGEAMQMVEEELRRLLFRRIEMKCNTLNPRSVAVAQRAGFKQERIGIQDAKENGRLRDTAYFGKNL